MGAYRFNKVLVFVLVTAFLSMQWSTMHIHQVAQHSPEQHHHGHHSDIHAHQLVDHHPNIIDFSHPPGSDKVVELDQQCNMCGKHLEKAAIALVSSIFQRLLWPSPGKIELPAITPTRISYLERSSVYLRAPPQFA